MLLLSGAAFANDCIVVFGRNDEIINVQAKNISMRGEEIVITLRKDYYEVDVTFDFFNSGAEEKVQLGFPVETSNIAPMAHFLDNVYDFKSYINNKLIPTRTTKIDTTIKNNGVNDIYTDIKWFIRDVTFPANSRTASKVTYKAKYSYCGGLNLAGYIYGTGRFWKGGIGKMTLIVNHGDDELIGKIRFGNPKGLNEKYDIKAKSSKFTWEADGKYKYVFENVNPTYANEGISIDVWTLKDGLYGGGFNPFLACDRTKRGNHLKNYHYSYFWAWSEELLYEKPTEIQFYTKNQIRLFINYFSALHGYDFKNPLYKEYFSKLNSFEDKDDTKYEVNPDFNESLFNEFEKKNVAYLLKLEKMIPNKTGEEKPK
jgi:hypothetical protein